MATELKRIQTLLNPDLFAEVATLASHQRRTMSAMSAELITIALKTDGVKALLEEALIKVPAQPDPRTRIPQHQYRDDNSSNSSDKARMLSALLDLIDDEKLDALIQRKAIEKL